METRPRFYHHPSQGHHTERSSRIHPSQCTSGSSYFLFVPQFPYQMEHTWGPALGEPRHMQVLYRGNAAWPVSLGDRRGLCLPCHFKQCLCLSLILTMCWQAEMSTLRGWCPPHPPSLGGCCVDVEGKNQRSLQFTPHSERVR